MSRRAFGLAVAVLAVGAGGCGARRFDVAGKVKYNGAALNKPDGQVVFVGPHDEQVAAPIGRDGAYQAAGVAAGLNRVVVYYPNPKAKREKEKAGKLKPGELPSAPESPYLTPAKYAAAETSGLSVAVEKDAVYDIDLTGPAIR
jgi:hypothetical protein